MRDVRPSARSRGLKNAQAAFLGAWALGMLFVVAIASLRTVRRRAPDSFTQNLGNVGYQLT